MTGDEDDRTVFQPAETPTPTPPKPEADSDRTVFEPSETAPAPDADRTVFQPSPDAPEIAPPPGPPPAREEADRTVFQPAESAPPPAAPPPPPPPPAAPRSATGGVQVGDTLNHMFEVKRFIARGGMGEVFEGINVASDEKVAIKIILPALAADPNVTAMFRREAQTLTRLSHPALVQYRVLAQEPQLGVFYIVTDFIDGVDLAGMLGKITPSTQDIIHLIRRLAEGLRAAHDLGAIHRDIAPDNVLLQGSRLDRARIIDFGIAKDVDPGSKTIIGDGFAGKLGYVAPEQLGMHGRDVGPWTDIYSLGLVVLALIEGRGSKLGGSFVEAIDKRRAGVDTSAAPAELRPLLDKMMAADPAERYRDMGEVLAALARVEAGEAPAGKPAPAKPASKPAKPAPAKPVTDAKPGGGIPKPAMIGGGAAVLLAVLGGAGWIAFGGGGTPAPTGGTPTTGGAAASSAVSIETVRGAVEKALPSLGCTWLSLASAAQSPSGVTLGFTGVAGRPADAEASMFKVVQGTGATVASSDFSGVAPIDQSFCAVLDRLRQVRSTASPRLSVSQPKYEIATFTDGNDVGKQGARVILDLALADLPADFALYGIEETGEISEIVPSRATFMQAVEAHVGIERLPGRDHYRLQLDGVRKPGWSGILLLTGKGGFSEPLLKETSGADWAMRFDGTAKSNDWQAEIVWFRFVDEVPN